MINTLLGKIPELFEKDFLFASFLPAFFLSGLAATLAAVVGLDAVWGLVESWTAVQKTVLTASVTLGIIVFAYILNVLRTPFILFWSGNSNFPLYLFWGHLRVGEILQRWRHRRIRERAQRFSSWLDVLTFFENKVKPYYNENNDGLLKQRRRQLIQQVHSLYEGMDATDVKERLQTIIDEYRKYSAKDLENIFKAVKTKLIDWDNKEAAGIQTVSFALDRRFGTLETVKATALGNVIESYNQYSFKRYKIEAEIFWPRLLHVIKPEYLKLVQEPKILLDFSITMASLGAIYSLGALLAGPWLWFNFWFWIPLAIVGLAICFFFYQLGISAAYQYGEMVRSSFDLFRLDLMAALARPDPPRFSKEQKQWEELSKLAVYGTKIDFDILQRKPP